MLGSFDYMTLYYIGRLGFDLDTKFAMSGFKWTFLA